MGMGEVEVAGAVGQVAVPDAPAREQSISQAGEKRSARLESLRAIGCLGVVSAHVYIITRVPGSNPFATTGDRFALSGAMGFFVLLALSGYLIYWPFAKRDFGGGGPIDLRSYLRNRAYRIFPLYYITLVLLLVFQQGGGTFSQWWHFALFAQSYSSATVNTVDGPMWSLCVELYFYALIPLIAYGIARVSRGNRLYGAAALLVLLAGTLAVRHTVPADSNLMWHYSFPVNFIYFLPGMALALFRTAWEERRPRWADGLLGRAEVWLALSIPFWVISIENYRHEDVTVIAAFLTLGSCALGLRSSRLMQLLDWKPLAVIGIASYSIYIWHLPLLGHLLPRIHGALPLLFVGGGLAIVGGYLSYRIIEEPFLRLRKRWAAASAPVR